MDLTTEHVTPTTPPARPPGPSAMRMRWLDLLFMHWPVPVADLRPMVPGGLAIETFDGTAWIGLVPFGMEGIRLRGLPPIPTTHRFLECNVRTYVTRDGEPGVWFLSLDAASRLAVFAARRFWYLNYVHAAISVTRKGDTVDYALRRRRGPDVTMRCRWHVGAPLPRSKPGDLVHFLTERYAMYACAPDGSIHRNRIWHEPWSLREASLEHIDDDLVAANGVTVDMPKTPLVMHADRVDAEAWKRG